MAISLNVLRNLSWLSQASYLDLFGLDRDTDPAIVATRLQTSDLARHNRFSRTQAEVLLGIPGGVGYAIQHHTPNDSYGFSASVFKSSSANEYTIAIRGTEFFDDFTSDLLDAGAIGIALQGAAKKQLFSAYRYYKQLITPEGQQVHYTLQEQTLLASLQSGKSNPIK